MNNKIRNRKGFTLAELLIVVAIIAVLTAIAVPLFVNGLNKADKAVEAANIRAVRGEAVTVILTAESSDTHVYLSGKTKLEEMTNGWDVSAVVLSNGQFKQDSFTIKPTAIVADSATPAESGTAVKGSDGEWTVTLHINLNSIK